MSFIRTTTWILFIGLAWTPAAQARRGENALHRPQAHHGARAVADSMTWFRTQHVQIANANKTPEGDALVSVYADGEWHGASCFDTIPADSPTVIALGPARLVVPAAAWQAQDAHTFTYFSETATRLWHVSVDIERGTWWVWLLDREERGAWRTLDSIDVNVRLNDRAAHENLPLRVPTDDDALFAYYQAGVAPMTCFSLDSLSVQRKPHGHDWWTSYVQAQGVYNLSDCHQRAGLTHVGAQLQVGWAVMSVPLGGFKPAGHGWYTYTHQNNTLTWWLSVHPSSGAFTVNMWSTAADITDGKGRLSVSLQLADQLGSVDVPTRPLGDASGYTVRSQARDMCPTLH